MSSKKNRRAFSKKGMVSQLLTLVIILLVAGGSLLTYGAIKYLNTKTAEANLSILSIEKEMEAKSEIPEGKVEAEARKCMLSDSVVMYAKNKYTEAASGNHDFELWGKDADTSDPNQVYISAATTSSGKATDTGGTWESCFTNTDFDLYTEGGSTYYDDLIDEWYLIYQENTADSLMHFVEMDKYGKETDRIWHAVLPIGTFNDWDDLASCDGASCGTTDTAELDDSGTDEITYNATTGDGSFYIEEIIGNTVSQTSLKDVVLCFQDANTGTDALDGNEVSSLVIDFVSGTDIRDKGSKMDGEVVNIWKESAGTGSYVCNRFASLIDGAKSGKYKFSFTLVDANLGANEQIKICLDDNGNYGAFEYPSGNTKGTASCWTLKNRT